MEQMGRAPSRCTAGSSETSRSMAAGAFKLGTVSAHEAHHADRAR